MCPDSGMAAMRRDRRLQLSQQLYQITAFDMSEALTRRRVCCLLGTAREKWTDRRISPAQQCIQRSDWVGDFDRALKYLPAAVYFAVEPAVNQLVRKRPRRRRNKQLVAFGDQGWRLAMCIGNQ